MTINILENDIAKNQIEKILSKEFKKDITEDVALNLLGSVVERVVFQEDLTKGAIDNGEITIWAYKGKLYSNNKIATAIVENEILDYKKICQIL